MIHFFVFLGGLSTLVSVFFRGVDHASSKCQKSNLMNSTNCKLATAFGTPFVTYFRFQILDFTFQISDFLLGAQAPPFRAPLPPGGSDDEDASRASNASQIGQPFRIRLPTAATLI